MREGVVLVVVVVVALPESVREERECRVTPSSLSTFSADYNTHTPTHAEANGNHLIQKIPKIYKSRN